ncbi:MAG: molecular chaperone DnaJ [Armatimonadetes bacterium]|nr:molecular chaperone DnaJ [Armatimonadota bacterium]
MTTEIARQLAPEERELERKKAELSALEERLAQRELELATLQGELHAFEQRYVSIVGVKYAELDEIEAQIAEAQARLNPQDENVQDRAEQARQQARESSESVGDIPSTPTRGDFRPSDELKRLYREAAKLVHPDLAEDEADRERRTRVMAGINRAYEAGDEESLRRVLHEWQTSPDSVKGQDPGAQLIRVIRKIAQVETRLLAVDAAMEELRKSDLHQLQVQVEEADEEGRDLLDEMAEHLDIQVQEAEERLATLSSEGRDP